MLRTPAAAVATHAHAACALHQRVELPSQAAPRIGQPRQRLHYIFFYKRFALDIASYGIGETDTDIQGPLYHISFKYIDITALHTCIESQRYQADTQTGLQRYQADTDTRSHRYQADTDTGLHRYQADTDTGSHRCQVGYGLISDT